MSDDDDDDDDVTPDLFAGVSLVAGELLVK